MLKYFFFLVLRILIKKHEWKHFCSPTKSTVALSSGVAVVKTASANTTKKNTYRKSNNLNNFPLIQPIILLLFLLRCDWNALCRRELSSDHFLQRQQVNCLADGGFSLLKTRCFLYATDVTIFEKGRSSANWSLSKSTMNDWSASLKENAIKWRLAVSHKAWGHWFFLWFTLLLLLKPWRTIVFCFCL